MSADHKKKTEVRSAPARIIILYRLKWFQNPSTNINVMLSSMHHHHPPSPPPTITTIIYASPPAHCLIDVDEEEEGLQQRGGDHKPDSEHSSVNLIFRLSEEYSWRRWNQLKAFKHRIVLDVCFLNSLSLSVPSIAIVCGWTEVVLINKLLVALDKYLSGK